MADALLPPDPTRKENYWLRVRDLQPEQWLWLPDSRNWFSKNTAGSVVRYAEGMAEDGYTLASPHPIPTAAQLDALHALVDEMVQKQKDDAEAANIPMKDAAPWILAARDCARMLRAALKGDAT